MNYRSQNTRINWGALCFSVIWAFFYMNFFIAALLAVLNTLCFAISQYYGFFMLFITSLILGFNGNKWALKRFGNITYDEFLYKQKRFFIINIIIFFIFIPALIFILMNLSPPINNALYILNNNNEAQSYFGKNITKTSYWNYVNTTHNTERYQSGGVTFNVKGSKNKGVVEVQYFKIDSQIYTTQLIINPNGSNAIHVVDPFIKATFTDKKFFNIHNIAEIVKAAEEDYQQNIVWFIRSYDKNDFMSAIVKNREYVLMYNEGTYNKNNLFYSPSSISKNEVLKLFKVYADGTDNFKKVTKWIKIAKEINTDTYTDHIFEDGFVCRIRNN
jgi:hypothetical protein